MGAIHQGSIILLHPPTPPQGGKKNSAQGREFKKKEKKEKKEKEKGEKKRERKRGKEK